MLESFMKRGRGADDEDEGGGFEGVLSSRHRRHASQDVAGGVLGWQQDMGQTEDDVKLDLPYLSGWEVAAFRLKFKKAVADNAAQGQVPPDQHSGQEPPASPPPAAPRKQDPPTAPPTS